MSWSFASHAKFSEVDKYLLCPLIPVQSHCVSNSLPFCQIFCLCKHPLQSGSKWLTCGKHCSSVQQWRSPISPVVAPPGEYGRNFCEISMYQYVKIVKWERLLHWVSLLSIVSSLTDYYYSKNNNYKYWQYILTSGSTEGIVPGAVWGLGGEVWSVWTEVCGTDRRHWYGGLLWTAACPYYPHYPCKYIPVYTCIVTLKKTRLDWSSWKCKNL